VATRQRTDDAEGEATGEEDGEGMRRRGRRKMERGLAQNWTRQGIC
jgi:hypothetical protein